jgi:hypothetical protein
MHLIEDMVVAEAEVVEVVVEVVVEAVVEAEEHRVVLQEETGEEINSLQVVRWDERFSLDGP